MVIKENDGRNNSSTSQKGSKNTINKPIKQNQMSEYEDLDNEFHKLYEKLENLKSDVSFLRASLNSAIKALKVLSKNEEALEFIEESESDLEIVEK